MRELTLFEAPLSAEPDRDTLGAMAISGGAPALASAAATVATGRATRFGVVTSRDDVDAPPSRLRVSSLVDSEENINMHENVMATTCVEGATNLDFRLAWRAVAGRRRIPGLVVVSGQHEDWRAMTSLLLLLTAAVVGGTTLQARKITLQFFVSLNFEEN